MRIFEIRRLSKDKVGAIIWQGIMDYGCMDWSKTKEKLKTMNAMVSKHALEEFDAMWACSNFCVRQGLVMNW